MVGDYRFDLDCGRAAGTRTVLRAMAALCDSGVLEVDDLPAAIRQARAVPARLSEHPLEDAEKVALVVALEQAFA